MANLRARRMAVAPFEDTFGRPFGCDWFTADASPLVALANLLRSCNHWFDRLCAIPEMAHSARMAGALRAGPPDSGNRFLLLVSASGYSGDIGHGGIRI